MINADDLTHGEPIYTHIEDDGTTTNIASARLRQWCLDKNTFNVFAVPVKPELVNEFLEQKAISIERVLTLKPKQRLEPILFCKDGTFNDQGLPDVFLVDGHHRYARAAIEREIFIDAWVLEPAQWLPFKIENLPNITQDQLRNIPVVKRPYWGK